MDHHNSIDDEFEETSSHFWNELCFPGENGRKSSSLVAETLNDDTEAFERANHILKLAVAMWSDLRKNSEIRDRRYHSHQTTPAVPSCLVKTQVQSPEFMIGAANSSIICTLWTFLAQALVESLQPT